MKIKILDKEFEIKAKFFRAEVPAWENLKLPHFRFRISVKNLKIGKTIFFNFWDSYENFRKGKKELNDEDLIFCFKCFLDDAISYYDNQDINDFASEFGYDDIKACLRAWKGCKVQYEKVKKLGLNDDDLINIFNKIVELENEDKLLTLIA
jgi:hypothetical protein